MTKMMYVYIMASQKRGSTYIGVTNDLMRRAYEHKSKTIKGFTQEHDIDKLVHYEAFDSPEHAIRREKRLKKWKRAWKIRLIENFNPDWIDLYPGLF